MIWSCYGVVDWGHMFTCCFAQEYWVNYEEIFAPVTGMTPVRTLIYLAFSLQWPLIQNDIKNAILNSDLSEEVYICPPPDLEHPQGHVWRLKRALYGLKQAPRAWFEKFNTTLLHLGFFASPNDTTPFMYKSSRGRIILLLYVDDMIILGYDSQGIDINIEFLIWH